MFPKEQNLELPDAEILSESLGPRPYYKWASENENFYEHWHVGSCQLERDKRACSESPLCHPWSLVNSDRSAEQEYVDHHLGFRFPDDSDMSLALMLGHILIVLRIRLRREMRYWNAKEMMILFDVDGKKFDVAELLWPKVENASVRVKEEVAECVRESASRLKSVSANELESVLKEVGERLEEEEEEEDEEADEDGDGDEDEEEEEEEEEDGEGEGEGEGEEFEAWN